MNSLRRFEFQNFTFLSTKLKPPACGYFAVAAELFFFFSMYLYSMLSNQLVKTCQLQKLELMQFESKGELDIFFSELSLFPI